LTASTEYNDLNINLARLVLFAKSDLTTQRAVRIQAPTYGFDGFGANTLTTASTVQIDSAPTAGVNAVITNSYALRVLTGTATGVGIVIQGATSQTGDLFQIQNISGTKLLYVDSNYSLYLARSLNLTPFNTSAGNTSELRFYELAANGTTYVGFKAGDNIPNSVIWTLPTTDGTSGQVLSTNASSTLAWSSRVNYIAGTSAPASPVAGDHWYDTNNAILFVYINDGDTSQWVETSGGATNLDSWAGSSNITTVGTLITPVITGLKETKSTLAANNIDLTLGNYFTKTITALTTFTVTNTPTTGIVASFILDLTNGGAYTITWWTGVKWASGTAPTLTASGRDCLGFFTHDGGATWSGLLLGKDLK
jgi:hypothetical protein